MKKIFAGVAAVVSVLALAGCASTGGAGAGKPYTITDGDGVIGYYTFDEDEIVDNEVVDHSG